MSFTVHRHAKMHATATGRCAGDRGAHFRAGRSRAVHQQPYLPVSSGTGPGGAVIACAQAQA
eukprot:364782-Chlamydomonas_euryale.AAC.21